MLLTFMILHKLTRKQANQRYLNSKELIIMKNIMKKHLDLKEIPKESIKTEKDVLQEIALSTLSVEQASNDLDGIVLTLFDLIDALKAKTKNNNNYIDLIDAINIKYTEMNYLFNQLSDISTELGKAKSQIFNSINVGEILGDAETRSIQK